MKWFTLLLLGSLSCSAMDGVSTMGTNTPMWGQTWHYYNGSDAPEGAWRVNTTMTPTTAIVTNSFTLPAGTNYFLFKVMGYGTTNGLWVVSGVNSNYVPVINGDWNKYWTTPIPVMLDIATNVYVIEPNLNTQIILRGVYITTNANENVYAESGTGYDYILDYTYSTNLLTASPAGNLLEDGGGFDTGLGHGWGLNCVSGVRDAALTAMWDTNVFLHGAGSFHVPEDTKIARGSYGTANYSAVLESKPFKLRQTQHTISVWTRNVGSGRLTIQNPIDVPTNFPNARWSASATIAAGTNWHRTSITTNFLCYPSDDFQVLITLPTNTWLDSVCVEEGPLTDYATNSLVLGVWTGRTGNLFSSDETVTLWVNGFGTESGTRTICYEVYDWLNAKVASNAVSLTLTGGQMTKAEITPNLGKTGTFRLLLWASGTDTMEEALFVVAPAFTASQTNLFAGTHAPPADWALPALWKAGIRSTRVMSAAKLFNWSNVEPTNDGWVWQDADAWALTNAANPMDITGTLYENPAWQTISQATNNPAEWLEYITNVVTRYPCVRNWEVWNEPLYVMNQTAYVILLTNAAQAIHAIAPSARVVAFGGVHNDAWVRTALDILGPSYTNFIDVISTHMYPTDADPSGGDTANKAWRFKTNIADTVTVPIWNTEAGIYDLGMMVRNANYLAPGSPLWPHLDSERFQNGSHYYPELSLKNALYCFGWGQSRYYYYDSRTAYPRPSYFKTHTTTWDIDDSIKPKLLLLSVLNGLVGDAVGQGRITNSTAMVYLLAQGTNTWLALWSSNQLAKSMTFTNSTLLSFDAMGNAIGGTTNTVFFARKPIYVKGAGIDTNTMRTMATYATVSNLSDTTAPNLSIDVGPRTAGSKTALFRWWAADDVDVPSESTPNAIVYASQVDGGAWSGWGAGTTRTVTLTNNSTAFAVAARDTSGNAVTNLIELGVADEPEPAPEETPGVASGTATATSVHVGTLRRAE